MQEQHYQEGYSPQPAQEQKVVDPDTGPLKRARDWIGTTFNSGGRPQRRTRTDERPREDNRSQIEKMRDTVADFDEDYKNAGDRLFGLMAALVGYGAPFAMVLFVGAEIGAFFTSSMGAFSSYGISYTMELVVAALCISVGRAFEEMGRGKASYVKVAAVVGAWLLLNASSALIVFLIISHYGNVPRGIIFDTLAFRAGVVALVDIGASFALLYRGKSMQRHIESIRKRATAIGELADAQRAIEEADKNAALREQMMKATLKIQDDMSRQIGKGVEMVMDSILQKMEKSLRDEDNGKGGRGHGRL